LSLEEALRFSYRTQLEASQPADIAVLDADPQWLMDALAGDVARASDALRQMPVVLTLCAGVVTHREL
jgi:predicted amidohydrolase YtcJ